MGTTITAIIVSLFVSTPLAIALAISHLIFNSLGICIIYPIKKIREIPIKLAEEFSIIVGKYPLVAISYIVVVFFLIPIFFIWTF